VSLPNNVFRLKQCVKLTIDSEKDDPVISQLKFIQVNFIVNPDQYCRVESVCEKLFLDICDVREWFCIKCNTYVVTHSVLTDSSKVMFVFAASQDLQ
jgi:hypothetical protein